MKMKKVLALALALVTMLSLVACGGDKPAAEQPKEDPPVAAEPEEVTPPDADVQYKETIWLGYPAPDKVAPYQDASGEAEMATTLCFDTVVRVDYNTGEILPELAHKWESNADATEWTFYLEKGVTFHNGNPFTADDVKFTWEFAIPGNEGITKGITATADVSEIVVVDDYTIKFVLNHAVPDFANYLETKIYDKETFEDPQYDDLEKGAIGTGPYIYDWDQHIPGQQDMYVRNENYWRGTENYPTKNIGWKFLSNLEASVNALQAGQVDIVPGATFTYYNQLINDPNVNCLITPGASIYHMAFNYRNPIMQDVKVRTALAQAINKEDIVNIFFEGGVGGFAHDNYCPPTGLGYTDDIDTIEYDLEAAKAVLEPMNLKLTLACYAANQKLCEVIQACLKEAGVEVEVVVASNWDAYKRAGEEYDFYAEYGSYQGALLYNFNRFFSRDGASNPYKYDSQEFEDLMAKCRACSTYEEMVEAFADVQQHVATDVASFPLAVSNNIVPTSVGVEGIQTAPTYAFYDYSMARIPVAD